MNQETVNRLLELNRQFYQTFALQFSATRQRLQPGVRQILEGLPPSARILDLGCGNGELWRELVRRGHTGLYVGLDFSPSLLDEAKTPAGLFDPPPTHFQMVDLASLDWDTKIPGQPFDFAVAFAVLHHLPSMEIRRQVIEKVRRLLLPGGKFIHSEWQFLNSPRLRDRIQPWETVGLSVEDVDIGDYLLDWRQGGHGLRYVHHFNEAELKLLAERAGFQVQKTFYSDGVGGNLGMYQTWV